jgi:hypothetical protein
MSDINEALGIESEPSSAEIANEKITNTNGKIILAVIFYSIAAIISIYGLYTTYQTPTSISKIVGGDAYNYIIYASRGIVLIGFGILISIIGLAIQLSAKSK